VRRRLPLTLLCVAAAVAASSAHAAAPDTFQIVSSGTAVFPDRTYVITLDQQRKLQSEDVLVTENGEPVGEAVVQSAATASGVGTVLLIDASNSMRGQPIIDEMKAARAFAARNPNQLLGIISFNDRVQTLLPLTTDQRAIARALSRTPRNREGTHIYDALVEAVKQLNARAFDAARIVLLSDGQEVRSTVPREVALGRLKQGRIRVFTVGLQSYAFDAGYLKELSAQTNGTYAEASSSKELAGIYSALGFRLSNEYILRYRSSAGPKERVDVSIQIGEASRSYSYVTPATGSGGPYERSLKDRVIQSWLLVPFVVFVVVALFAFAVRSLFWVRSNQRFQTRLGQYVELEHEERARRRRQEVAELLALAPDKVRWSDWQPLRRYAEDVAVARMRVRFGRLLFWSIFGGLLLAAVAGVAIGTAAAVLALALPIAVRADVKRRAAAQRRQFADQLPDNLEVMASALRAGQSLAVAMASVVEEAAEPSQTEFRRVVTDDQLGVPLDEALEVSARRMDSADMQQVAIVAMLQREAGGNMAEVLDQVIVNVRGGQELNRLVRVLTAQGRMARWIVTFIPIGLLVLIAVASPGYIDPLFEDPLGRAALVFAAVSVSLGFFAINRIVSIKV
jgi:tight adherence protein B